MFVEEHRHKPRQPKKLHGGRADFGFEPNLAGFGLRNWCERIPSHIGLFRFVHINEWCSPRQVCLITTKCVWSDKTFNTWFWNIFECFGFNTFHILLLQTMESCMGMWIDRLRPNALIVSHHNLADWHWCSRDKNQFWNGCNWSEQIVNNSSRSFHANYNCEGLFQHQDWRSLKRSLFASISSELIRTLEDEANFSWCQGKTTDSDKIDARDITWGVFGAENTYDCSISGVQDHELKQSRIGLLWFTERRIWNLIRRCSQFNIPCSAPSSPVSLGEWLKRNGNIRPSRR